MFFLTNRDEMRKSYKGPSKLEAFCIILLYLAKWFQNRNKHWLWWQFILTDRDKINTLHRGTLIVASYHVAVHLAKRFQIRRFLEINQLETRTRKNCFRYLKHMFPLNVAICTTTYLERQKCYVSGKKILFKIQLFDLEVKGHYGMRHTALSSCTYIPNIIDLSWKTKMLWPRQENTI